MSWVFLQSMRRKSSSRHVRCVVARVTKGSAIPSGMVNQKILVQFRKIWSVQNFLVVCNQNFLARITIQKFLVCQKFSGTRKFDSPKNSPDRFILNAVLLKVSDDAPPVTTECFRRQEIMVLKSLTRSRKSHHCDVSCNNFLALQNFGHVAVCSLC